MDVFFVMASIEEHSVARILEHPFFHIMTTEVCGRGTLPCLLQEGVALLSFSRSTVLVGTQGQSYNVS
jgi:hypothetical protein